MKRSGGVTAAAVVLIVGSSLLVLMAGMVGLLPLLPQPANEQNPFGVGFFYFEAVFILAIAGWGIATAVGILRLRNWARISILVISGIAVAMLLFSGLSMLLIVPMLRREPGMPAGAIAVFAAIELIFLCVPLGIAIWWLVLFSLHSVRAQFEGSAGTIPAEMELIGTTVVSAPPRPPRIPVSILVIAIYFLATAPFSLIYFVSPLMKRMPMILFGQILPPRATWMYMCAVVIVHLTLGFGLVFRRSWAHPLTLMYCLFLLGNSAAAILRPSLIDRFMERVQQVDPAFAHANSILPRSFFHVTTSVGAILGLALILAALYFLWTRREAYRSTCAAKG